MTKNAPAASPSGSAAPAKTSQPSGSAASAASPKLRLATVNQDQPVINIPEPPDDLGAKGLELWNSIHEVFCFSEEPAKLAVLEEACRVRDLIHRLETEHRERSMSTTSTGSARQLTIHPIIAEVRAQRGTMNQLLRSLGLPEPEEV